MIKKEIVDRIVELGLSGNTINEIVDVTGVSYFTVNKYLKQNDINVKPDTRGHREPIPQDVVDKIIELRLQGKTYIEIGDITGVSHSTAARYWLESGLDKKEQLTKKIVELSKQGLFSHEVAERLGISKHQVAYYRRKAGIDGKAIMHDRAEQNYIKKKEDINDRKGIKYISQLNTVISTIEKYLGDSFEYDSGYTGCRCNITLKCKRCGNLISIPVERLRSWRRGFKPSVLCDVCETIEEENKRLEVERNDVVSEIERNEKRYAKISVLITTPREHTCKYCGKRFITYYGDKHTAFCSKTCSKRYNKRNRKKKIKHVLVDSDITLPLLAERDNDVCWLCGNKVDWNDICYTDTGVIVGPMYPSIDHVLALSNGGKHSWDNVRLAHCKCNTIKSDKLIESKDDFMEVGRCG